MIVTVPAAGPRVAPYQGIQLGSMWYVSLDYINHQTSLTADQARIDPDGRMRFVISERDPGLANWLECTGHRRGYVQIRWQRLARDLGRGRRAAGRGGRRRRPGPPRCRTTSRPGSTPQEYAARIAARQAAVPEQDAGLMESSCCCWRQGRRGLPGSAPAWAASIAVRSARAGADVVLAARTGVPPGRGGQGGHRAGPPRRWPCRPTSPTTSRPRSWPRPRSTRSAGSTRW